MILSIFFTTGVRDHLYKSLIQLREHTDDSGSFFGAFSFTSPVEQLALRAAPAESLLTWLTKPTSPHLVEVVSTSESHTALAILVTPEVLYNPYSPRVGLGLVYKALYIKTASFSEAFFYLKSASEAEVDKRITDSRLMFVQINEASKVIPLPGVQPLFLDVPTSSDVMDSNKPKSPCKVLLLLWLAIWWSVLFVVFVCIKLLGNVVRVYPKIVQGLMFLSA